MARPVGEALVSLLKRLGAEGVIEIIPVRRAAREVLKNYKGARFVHFKNGVLYVWSDDPGVRFRVQMLSRKIAKSVNALVGSEKVKEVRLRRTPPP